MSPCERHQRDVLPELAERAGDQRRATIGELGEVVALVVPAALGETEIELFGDAARDRHALAAELVEGADGAAELEDEQAGAERREPIEVARDGTVPCRDAVA